MSCMWQDQSYCRGFKIGSSHRGMTLSVPATAAKDERVVEYPEGDLKHWTSQTGFFVNIRYAAKEIKKI